MVIIGWLADQGTEQALGDCPYDRGAGLKNLIDALVKGDMNFTDAAAHSGYLLPEAITLPEFLHINYNALRESLESTQAWPKFEGLFRDFIKTLGDRKWRDRYVEVLMKNCPKHERRLMHTFSGHSFDWRWGNVEVNSEQLAERWPIMRATWNMQVITKDGELNAQAVGRINMAFTDELPGLEEMNAATYVVSHAAGHNARWLSGCDCHSDLHIECSKAGTSAARKKDIMKELTAQDHCPWMGRRLIALAHGAGQRLVDNMRDAATDRCNMLLAKAQDTVRSIVIDFIDHAKGSYCADMTSKLEFTIVMPNLLTGLFGMYVGYTNFACGAIAKKITIEWDQMADKSMAHRVTVQLMTNEVLLRQLLIMSDSPRDLHCLPQLFVFTLRYARLSVVGHWLEGRHRQIKLQMAGSGTHSGPGFQSFRLRKPELDKLLDEQLFLTFVGARFRSKSALQELLDSTFDRADTTGLTYQQKLQMLYGYHTSAQFKEIPQLRETIERWKRVTKRSSELAIPLKPFEKLALNYFKGRLEKGCMYIVTAEIARLAENKVLVASTLTADCFAEAFFAPRRGSNSLGLHDVAFVMIDPKPEAKQGYSGSHTVREVSHVVVRAHAEQATTGDTVSMEWSLERWDLRGWCSSMEIIVKVLGALRKVKDSAQQLVPEASRRRLVQRAALPFMDAVMQPCVVPPALEDGEEELAIETLDDDDGDIRALQFLAERLEEGASAMDLHEGGTWSLSTMDRLFRLGAIAACEDEIGDIRYQLRPAGIIWRACRTVHGIALDMDLIVDEDTTDLHKWPKIAVLFKLYGDGFKPISDIEGSDGITTMESERVVRHAMLTRSISYLQALASLDLIFMRKLVEFHHGGSEYYYKCLMELKDYSKLLAITGSPTIIADDVWKQILKKQNPHALCDGAIDEADIGAGAAAPKRKRRKADALAVAVVADSALLEPMNWNFPCGTARVSVCWDGCSHQSGRRRCYAKCPAHPACYCYTFIHQFEHPWQSVAHVLCHMRNGFGVESAFEHRCAPPPSDVDIEAIKDELLAILLAFKSEDVLVHAD